MSMRDKLKKIKVYQCKDKYEELPLKTLWTETMIFDQNKEFEYKIVYEVKD